MKTFSLQMGDFVSSVVAHYDSCLCSTLKTTALVITNNPVFVLFFPDVTAVCILEGFQNQQSMLLADKVLKLLGKEKAKEKYKV